MTNASDRLSPRILVIDDNRAIHDDFRKILSTPTLRANDLGALEAELFGGVAPAKSGALSYRVDSAFQGEEGLDLVRKARSEDDPYVLAFVDVRMPPGWDGVETITRLWQEYSDQQVVICTAYSDYSWDEMMARLPSSENLLILKKPFDHVEVLQLAAALNEKWRLRNQAAMKLDELERRVRERTSQLQQVNEELNAMAESLRIAKEAAESASEAKAAFLANVSHEIRTPLTAILGYADLLLDADVEDAQRVDAIQTIRHHGQNLLQILNDILDLSKVEAGKLTVERIACDPGQIAAEVVALLEVRARTKGVKLSLELDGAVPRIIRSDPVRIRQILTNLVGNAVKFTDQGSVRVVLKMLRADAERPDMLQFEVIDTGIGISAESRAKLFEPFTQGNASTTRRFGGTGLGLSISRRFAEALGGRIEVDSSPGRGSAFRVMIETGPMDGAEWIKRIDRLSLGEIHTTNAPPIKLCGHILVAEDASDNQRLLAHLLRSAGAVVDLVDNGQEALESALAKPYDAILMDMQMAKLDGYSATRRLRAAGYDRPIIALTAHAMSTDRQRCLDVGCDDYLTKPIDRRVLLQTVAAHMTRTVKARTAPESCEPTAEGTAGSGRAPCHH